MMTADDVDITLSCDETGEEIDLYFYFERVSDIQFDYNGKTEVSDE